jgi:thiol-disulfide isomerase/thioredoxin
MKIALLSVLLMSSSLFVKAQVAVGDIAPEISLRNPQDSLLSLSSLRGKVVLLDFWASWCAPCRAANPGVVRLYNKYKSKGFEVLGVSIDSKKEAWLKAVAQDRIQYKQVNDPAGWNSPVAENYGINQIPTSFLLDKEGKVIAIDLAGVQLEIAIQQLLKK